MKKKKSEAENDEPRGFGIEDFANEIPLSLDMPGIFFVEARKQVRSASRNLDLLNIKIQDHGKRVRSASRKGKAAQPVDSWAEIVHGVSGLETIFSKVIRDFAIADVLLVAAAEAYINAIAEHMLSKADATLFDKLSPTGKWVFLPKVMALDWRPDSSTGHLQERKRCQGQLIQ